MSFNSIHFLVFFPIVVAICFVLPFRYRWLWLLGASYYFYMSWRPEYALLLILSTLVDYYAGRAIYASRGHARRRLFLLMSLVVNFSLLFVFKYFNFFNGALRDFCSWLHLPYAVPDVDVLLPVGISFYTFQTLSYTFEVYLGRKDAERHLGYFALYVVYFPQLVAGPIERPQRLLSQLKQKHVFDYDRVTRGFRLMLWGMFKKVVIADRLAIVVNQVYAQPADYGGLALLTGTVFFAFQIYCDFSGYSDIAIGAARVMGIDLMKNFDRPYLARSIREFWGRWHISLSTWFRDYVYIPLGGNRRGLGRWQWNILLTFVLSGLWHGANWTFLAWGALHGFYYLFSNWTAGVRSRVSRMWRLERFPGLMNGLAAAATFTLVCLAWIFFRANTLGDAFVIISRIGGGLGQPLVFDLNSPGYIGLPWPGFVFSLGLILFLMAVQVFQGRGGLQERFIRQPVWVRWPVYIILTLTIMNLGISEEIPFIYFQF